MSSLAAACPRCGCPVASAPSQASPTTKKQKKPQHAGHIRTIPACILILLAAIGVTAAVARNSSPGNLPKQQAAPRRAPARKQTPPTQSFDADLAAQGKELHERLLSQASVHEFYLAGSLFGAVTPEPKASIAVPLDVWKTLSDDNRAKLMHYVASLVELMRNDPLAFSQISATTPAAAMVSENAKTMGPLSWVIHGGRLEREGNSFDILTDTAVALGTDYPLGPKRDSSAPNTD